MARAPARAAAVGAVAKIRKGGVEPVQTVSLPPSWMRIAPCLPELIHVPAGTFLMGDDFGPRSSRPAHELNLPDYWISRYPVTALEYAAYVVAARRPLPGFWPHPVRWLEEANRPAAGVCWREALGYCAWLAQQTGRQVRLPTEAEWEKATVWDADHGTKRLYPWGNDFDPAYCNAAESLIGATTPVDAYRLVGDSAYGVSDLFGNVAEWTLARYQPYPYNHSDGRHDLNLMGYRAARGGSFQSEGRWLTALHRQYFSPDETHYPVGFRIVVEGD
jgi:formylglycine-generating enzyme required for sulfatase activity